MADPPLDIIYRDRYMVAVNKPCGLLVHRSAVDARETRFALQLLRDQIGMRVYPVHRLDKPVSGVLVFALNPETARILSGHFSDGNIRKTYLAVVRGCTDDEGTIDHPLKEELDRTTDARARRDKGAQAAVTVYRRLGSAEVPYAVGPYARGRYSLVEIRPLTGRKHQVRRHMKHIFHPIIGDTKHGEGRHNRLFRERYDSHRLLLAATEMRLPHPATGEPRTVIAPLDAAFMRILDRLGWSGSVPGRWLG